MPRDQTRQPAQTEPRLQSEAAPGTRRKVAAPPKRNAEQVAPSPSSAEPNSHRRRLAAALARVRTFLRGQWYCSPTRRRTLQFLRIPPSEELRRSKSLRSMGLLVATIVAFGMAHAVLALLVDAFATWLGHGRWMALPPKELAALENTYRQLILTLLGGTLAAVTVYVGLRNLHVALRNQELAREGQITDRFSRAVEHLGSDKLDLRLGGIYALERIARDSPADQWTVVEVLSAFIRERAVPPSGEEWPPADPDAYLERLAKENSLRPPADIQAALTVIGRRDTQADPADGPRVIDLEKIWCPGLSLCNADMQRASLRHAYIPFARINRTSLSEADLSSACVARAWFILGSLEGTSMVDTDLRKATFHDVPLCWIRAASVNLQGAAFSIDCDLGGASLPFAKLEGASITSPSIRQTVLRKATYDQDTEGPPGFSFQEAGAIRVPPDTTDSTL